MVDSINPVGQAQSIQSVENSSSKQDEVKKVESSAPVDDVQISEEAINLAQAEQAARDVAASLSNNQDVTLSNDNGRLNTLA